MQKFGIRVPKTVAEALAIDQATGTDFWSKAIKKEMDKARIAWYARDEAPEDARKGKVKDLLGFQEIKCHMVFDMPHGI